MLESLMPALLKERAPLRISNRAWSGLPSERYCLTVVAFLLSIVLPMMKLARVRTSSLADSGSPRSPIRVNMALMNLRHAERGCDAGLYEASMA